MDLQARKIEFIQEFVKIQSESVINQFEKLLKKESKVSGNDFQPMSKEQLKARIDKSIEDADNEFVTNHEDLLLEIETWK